MALKQAKVPAELHVYGEGGHGLACAARHWQSQLGRRWWKHGCIPSRCFRRRDSRAHVQSG
ncbi:MAG: hypothetical protein WCA37_13495 [Terracidiphilus sp.]